MIIKTRNLTESLENKYSLNETYEVELDDEIDAIMDDDTLSDEEKEAEIGKVLDKHDKLNESFVEEWWGQTDEDPFEFAYEYGLTCKEVGRRDDETLYRFTGEKEDFDQAIKDGYFFSLGYGADEGHSEDLNESLNEDIDMPVGLYENVFSYVRSRIANEGVSNMMPDVASKVPEYNPEWFDDDWIIDDEIGSLIDKLAIKITDQLCGKYEYEV